MNKYVLFQMYEPYRQQLLAEHNFYIEQARKRLLAQFADFESEVEEASNAWLEKRSHTFNPDFDDAGSIYEDACSVGIEFYQLLSNMEMQTMLSVVAGMYYEWDKQLRKWLVDEIRHWHSGELTPHQVWSKDIGRLLDLLESLGWCIRSKPYFNKIDACRLVVNVYKHGKGQSLSDLKQDYPEYLPSPFPSGSSFPDYLEHTYLVVTDTQLKDFSDAIIAFWTDIPKDIFDADDLEISQWFANALEKDRENTVRSEK